MQSAFSFLDWTVFGAYFLILAITSYILAQTKITTSREYFVSANSMPMFAVAISVLATSQNDPRVGQLILLASSELTPVVQFVCIFSRFCSFLCFGRSFFRSRLFLSIFKKDTFIMIL